MKTFGWRLATVLGIVLVASIALARPEPNAFLNAPAQTHNELMVQVQKDPVVMSRYMRHFGKTKDEVVTYFQTLRMGKLEQDGVYLVYNVPDWEELRAKVVFYKAGTPVWIDPAGTVVLKVSCGNPMIRGTDDIAIVTQNDPILEMVDEPRELIKGDLATQIETGEASDLVLSDVETPLTIEASAQAFAPAMPFIPISIGSVGVPSIVNTVLPILAVPGAVLLTTGFNGGDSPPNPVPEPGTMIALAIGGGMIAARRRRK